MMVVLHFRIDGNDAGEARCGAVPAVGAAVTIEHGLRGRIRARVVDVNHQFTDSGIRRVDRYNAAPVIVDLEEER
ncbi:hypothetical protein ACH4T9_12715 [Micromonospora sp. NPDC020750]|uniref:hypothetical protein n=1 Tax=unclassified Micromonospora TaxID=2617518 RepID=UPI0037A8387B